MLPNILDLLCCPAHGAGLHNSNDRLFCEAGHEIPIEQGIPLFAEKPRRESRPLNMAPLPPRRNPGLVDEFVDDWIVNTNGNLYWHTRGRLSRYPIPRWPAPYLKDASDATDARQCLLDLGCSWGRWSIAAARAGFSVCGVDVHLDALWAAARVTRELGVSADFACCDADILPFKPGSIDVVFSYSVLQHLDRRRAAQVLNEIARVLRQGGSCFVQLPNKFGLASLCRQARRGFREPSNDTFEMRYWTRPAIVRAFCRAGLGNIRFRAEGFLLQNTQWEDMDLLSGAGAAAVLTSCALRGVANAVRPLNYVADSLWVEATKE
jgi:2-polyprenyl-3-methyl-5-hydroxy-6-metoxy-1,4-benzoquinol methylase